VTSRPLLTEKAQTPICCLVILAGIFYAYAQVGGHSFIDFDDGLYLFNNLRIIEGLTWTNLAWSLTNTDAANWHPITWLSLFTDREFFGPYSGGYLLMNVAYHGIASCLCFLAFKKATCSAFAGFAIAFFFALHPANAESVAWLSSRKSILDAIFWFLGIWLYLKSLDSGNRVFYLLVFTSHLLGLMCKSMHVTFPCALWLVHVLYFSKTKGGDIVGVGKLLSELGKAFKSSIPMLLVSIYFCGVTLVAQEPALSNLSLEPRLINSILSYERYLWMFFNPREFAPFYPFFSSNLHATQVIRPIIILLLITALGVLLLAKRSPDFLVGWLWYVGTLVPVIGLVQVGSQSHADRYLYIPCIGLGLMLVSLFNLLSSRSGRVKYLAAGWLCATTLSLAVATKIQAAYWKSGVILFKHSLSVTGDCVTSVFALANSYGRENRNREAMDFLLSKISIATQPGVKARLLVRYGIFSMTEAEPQAALVAFQNAHDLGLENKRLFYMMAEAALNIGDLALAEHYLALVASAKSDRTSQSELDQFLLDFAINRLPFTLEQKKAAHSEESDR
jgi:hypothetical protein